MNRNFIYFDNAAAARPDTCVTEAFRRHLEDAFANQEATHGMAHELRWRLAAAERQLTTALCGHETTVFHGNSGTGLFRLLGEFNGFRQGNIVTSKLEHPALDAALQNTGAEIRLVNIADNGLVDLDHLAALLDAQTTLIAIHHVQSEIGIIQDIKDIGEIVRRYAPQACFMSDTIQSAGKIPLPRGAAELDVAVVSGHKTGIPGGAALLLNTARPGIKKLSEYLTKCRNEYRIGRPDPATILTMGEVFEHICGQLHDQSAKMSEIRTRLMRELSALKLPNGRRIVFTAAPECSSPYILHFIVPGYQSAILMRMLAEKNIFFSAGSACQAESGGPSKALRELGHSKDDAYSGIRLSFWRQNTLEEAAVFVNEFKQTIASY